MLFRIPEFAKACGLSRSTVYKLISGNHVRVTRIGRAVRIPAEEVSRIILQGGVAFPPVSGRSGSAPGEENREGTGGVENRS